MTNSERPRPTASHRVPDAVRRCLKPTAAHCVRLRPPPEGGRGQWDAVDLPAEDALGNSQNRKGGTRSGTRSQ